MRHLRAALAAAGLFLAATTAQAATHYDRLYAFGDSFSDTGAGFAGSNGPTAVAQLAHRLGLSLAHSREPEANCRSINFAVASARTGDNPGRRIGDYWLVVGMQNQVEDFATRVQRGDIAFDPETTLFFIEGGLNDAGTPAAVTTANLTRQIERLRSVGARHVSVALLPTRIPAFREEALRLNPAYRSLVPVLRRTLGIDVRLNRFGAYLDDIQADPSRYGLVDTESQCAGNPLAGEDTTPCAAPDTYFYYLADHPSAAVSRIVGDRLYAEIVGAAR
ncbi:SGNH/GDSL hydrolase family protein [Lysobacter solisilvae (ex Woo and Kim 2020)]|uniref:GDSL family lipase n=1 Tax=Agrilutibacter terrestris TaxID=2865112 RepID=A0A7H0FU92_9GAMM|nr:SGNH/GDSL hydrolase family protein [Lysobacter terrestris]QNP39608.1 GDSL family lipase [Lysobacter terrestris]